MKKIDLEYNIEAHNKYARKYHKKHTEIFNEIEQKRLKVSLENALSYLNVDNTKYSDIKAFDYGCGSGNITHHLLSFGLQVTSADISQEFLNIIKETYSINKNSKTFLLNGNDLSEISDNTYDFLCVYSVLHHIPDYLAALQEMIRVVKPGGLIYIDHERSPEYWAESKSLREFISQVPKKSNFLYYFNVFNPKWYVKKYHKIKNPRWQVEGDIHVWKDDHIEWDKIDTVMEKYKMKKVFSKDYLSYLPEYPIDLFQKYAVLCSDMRCSVFLK